MKYIYNATPEQWMTGDYDATIVEVMSGRTRLGFVARTRDYEGPLRPEYAGARMDLLERAGLTRASARSFPGFRLTR